MTLKDLLKVIQKFAGDPFLFTFSHSHHLLLLLDKAGKIEWAYNPLNGHEYFEAVHLLLEKEIGEFYRIPSEGLGAAGEGIATIGALQKHLAGQNPNDVAAPISLLKSYPSRNRFENFIDYFNFHTTIPMSHLRLLRVDADHFLGIIFFSSHFRSLSRQYEKDVTLLIDGNKRVLGHNDALRGRLLSPEDILGKPLSQLINLDFLTPRRPPFTERLGGKVRFTFPAGQLAALETNDPSRFALSSGGIDCDTRNSPFPAFWKLPAALPGAGEDFELSLTFGNILSEPPLVILNASGLNGAIYPDYHGLLFGPQPPLDGRVKGGGSFFIAKLAGDPISTFNAFAQPPLKAGEELEYRFVRKAGDLIFYINRQPLGAVPAGRLYPMPGADGIVVGLRPGHACRIKSARLRAFEAAPSGDEPEQDVTYFLHAPERLYQVHTQYLTGLTEGIVTHLRLEDLDALEQIKRLSLEKREKEKEIERLKKGLQTKRRGLDRISGDHPETVKMRETLKTIALSEAPLLLTGETGTGKSLVALSVHEASRRKKNPFVQVDCAALPESLIESELFGYERGAFTGARKPYAGKFEQAAGGTLFLDEIGNVPLHLQAKLLHVLQEFKITRLGGKAEIPLDIRLIAATNAGLERLVREGRFRDDLFYRLNVLRLELPPLRERKEDLPALCEYFLNDTAGKYGHLVETVSREALAALSAYDWPGNVRELQNLLLKSLIFCKGKVLQPEDIALPGVHSSSPTAAAGPIPRRRDKRTVPLQKIVDEIKACRGNVAWASENLKMARFTVYRRLKEAGLNLR